MSTPKFSMNAIRELNVAAVDGTARAMRSAVTTKVFTRYPPEMDHRRGIMGGWASTITDVPASGPLQRRFVEYAEH